MIPLEANGFGSPPLTAGTRPAPEEGQTGTTTLQRPYGEGAPRGGGLLTDYARVDNNFDEASANSELATDRLRSMMNEDPAEGIETKEKP